MASTSFSAPGPGLAKRKTSLLVGKLDINGLAQLEVDESASDRSSSMGGTGPRSLKVALDTAALINGGPSEATTPGSASEEDYDKLHHDLLTVRADGKGGGFNRDQAAEATRGEPNGESENGLLRRFKRSRSTPPNLTSIPIALQKTNEKGQYYLIADDVELKEILKMGFDRENSSTLPKRRKKFSDLVFTRQFTAFDRQNTASAASPFHGFFTLFWLGVTIFMIQIAAKNWRAYGNILGTNEILGLMLQRDLMVLGISDGILFASTGFGWILQKLILKGYLNWDSTGWIVQNVWQTFYVFALLFWTLFREWPWNHTVFFVLHGLVMLMKQHSYAFYNGHLSSLYKTRRSLEQKLKRLKETAPVQSPSATAPEASSLSTSYLDSKPVATELNRRRQSSSNTSTTDRARDLAQVASAIESGGPLDADQIQTFKRIVRWEIDALFEDLKGKATMDFNYYPNNLTISNHFEFILLPTLVYELEYPRTDKINWFYVIEKAIAIIGILFVMMLVSQTFIYPVVMKTVEMKESGMPLQKRLEQFPWILSDLIFPFMMEYMMTWYILFESLLNFLAELTYFADRGFYGDWWNSVSWDQFARDWNRPVHNFLLRHVYHSSISSMRVNKYTATLITFFLSAIVHELALTVIILVMWTLFKKLRGYLLFFQMMQIPLVQLSRTRWLKGRAVLGNLIFWIGIFTGPSLLCSLYLVL